MFIIIIANYITVHSSPASRWACWPSSPPSPPSSSQALKPSAPQPASIILFILAAIFRDKKCINLTNWHTCTLSHRNTTYLLSQNQQCSKFKQYSSHLLDLKRQCFHVSLVIPFCPEKTTLSSLLVSAQFSAPPKFCKAHLELLIEVGEGWWCHQCFSSSSSVSLTVDTIRCRRLGIIIFLFCRFSMTPVQCLWQMWKRMMRREMEWMAPLSWEQYCRGVKQPQEHSAGFPGWQWCTIAGALGLSNQDSERHCFTLIPYLSATGALNKELGVDKLLKAPMAECVTARQQLWLQNCHDSWPPPTHSLGPGPKKTFFCPLSLSMSIGDVLPAT